MRPPYEITPAILHLVAAISENMGVINAVHLHKPPTELRKRNRIKTIQSSLEIEGNTLTEEQITGLLENKRILAPKKDLLEVQNAIEVYEKIQELNPYKLKDLERAHGILMKGLVANPGKLRSTNVGIVKGSKVEHLAPGGALVKGLVKDLLQYLRRDEDLLLIKSCVFHYEFEFIHPFLDGNGRMGRLWQTIILMQQYPVFEFLPVESLIRKNQNQYYKALGESDKKGVSTPFIEFMLNMILQSLENILSSQNRSLTAQGRIEIFKDKIGLRSFTRKEYLNNFKEISQATASRDLRRAVDEGILERMGEKNKTEYQFKSRYV